MSNKSKFYIHLGEIIRFDDPDSPWLRVHVKMGLPIDNDEQYWKGEIVFMLPDEDATLSEIEKQALQKTRECLISALGDLDVGP